MIWKFKWKTVSVHEIVIEWLGEDGFANGQYTRQVIVCQENGFGRRRTLLKGIMTERDTHNHPFWCQCVVPWLYGHQPLPRPEAFEKPEMREGNVVPFRRGR